MSGYIVYLEYAARNGVMPGTYQGFIVANQEEAIAKAREFAQSKPGHKVSYAALEGAFVASVEVAPAELEAIEPAPADEIPVGDLPDEAE